MEYLDEIETGYFPDGEHEELIEACRNGEPRLYELWKKVDLHGWYTSDPHVLAARDTLRSAANKEAARTLPYANHFGFSDVHPYEIVKRVSDICLEVRRMKSERSNPENNLGFEAGGFFGHSSRQNEQEWKIESDPSQKPYRIRLRKDGHWYDPWGNRYGLSATPKRFHDYNF